MLFKVHASLADTADFFEMNPGARAIEAYNKCTSRQMFFVCLVADKDWDSPLKSLPERERRTRATQVAGWGMEGDRPDKNARNLINGKVTAVEAAIVQYQKDQYDEEKAMYWATDAQIKEIIEMMSRDKQEACRVVKIKIDGKTKAETRTEYVDQIMAAKMASEALKLGVQLPALRETRFKLQGSIAPEKPIDNLILNTAEDLVGDPDDSETDEDMSDLDIFMEKQRQVKENGEREN